MKRRGFTLAEVLICLGIIGVVAAVMLPMVNKFKPDENKVRYLQTYRNLTEIIPSIANNKEAFPVTNEGDPLMYYHHPLLNTKAKYNIDGTDYDGTAKFCRMLAASLNTTGTISCSNDQVYDSNEIPNFKSNFETINGVQFMVQTKSNIEGTTGTYQSDIFLDVNGASGDNCFVTEEGCKKPDRFKISVASDGHVIAADPLGKEHLATRANWKLNRDKLIEGEMANLPDSELKQTLETVPVETPEDPNEGSGTYHFKCGTNNDVWVNGKYMNCWGYKYDNSGNIKMYVNKPIPDNIYVLRYLNNDTTHIGWQLCTLPAGQTESVCGKENAIYKQGYSETDVNYYSTASLFGAAFSGRAFVSGDNVCVLGMGLFSDSRKFMSEQPQEWLDKYDIGGSYDYGKDWEESIGTKDGYINNPVSREDAISNITSYFDGHIAATGFTKEDLDKLRSMVTE